MKRIKNKRKLQFYQALYSLLTSTTTTTTTTLFHFKYCSKNKNERKKRAIARIIYICFEEQEKVCMKINQGKIKNKQLFVQLKYIIEQQFEEKKLFYPVVRYISKNNNNKNKIMRS